MSYYQDASTPGYTDPWSLWTPDQNTLSRPSVPGAGVAWNGPMPMENSTVLPPVPQGSAGGNIGPVTSQPGISASVVQPGFIPGIGNTGPGQNPTGNTPTPPPASGAFPTNLPPGTPWKDPATGQCYVAGAGGKLSKAQAGACGGPMPAPPVNPQTPGPPGTMDPGDPDPGDGPIPPITPPVVGGPGDPSLPQYAGNQPPPYDPTLPDIDPYTIGASPDPTATGVGGVSAIDPQAQPFQYDEVSDFADSAWEQAMRYLRPEMDLEDRRYDQMLINRGIDPFSSEAGKDSFRMKEMSQNDRLSKAAFDALGFGRDTQQQMFGQSKDRAELSNQLLQAMMGLKQRGHEFDTTAGLNANQQAFAQMLALEGLDYRDYQTLIDQMRYDDSLALALLGIGAPPGYSTVNTGLPGAPYADLQNEIDMWNTPLFGS